ncbi:MAG: SPFH/Band 7/PHB domain protein [Maricaulis sp.]|uniref:SPFH domain-containing protein n=1 Tax=Maricaulis sp. TaxID=1486257 RepID=UPI001B2F0984|nr:SPFH domain-containing protein [Maricaulis sp.]MBO6878283.1 SPFH/Band 7/PHB domain protein [Maricaulis sp.]
MLELTLFLLAIGGIIFGLFAVKIVPQSEKYVIERLGRLHKVLGPGVNFIFPILDSVRWKGKILERQDPEYTQDAITGDNVILKVTTVVFYRITEPEKSVYRIQNPADAVRTTVTGIVRSQVGKLDLDAVQSNRAELNENIRQALGEVLDGWGIEVTRTEVIDVELDAKTQEAMLKQLNAERERRAAVMAAEGEKRSIELEAEAKLYAAQKEAEARRLTADAEAYATETVAKAIAKNGLSAAQYQVALKQVEALTALGNGEGRQTLVLPASLADSFGDAFKLFKSQG